MRNPILVSWLLTLGSAMAQAQNQPAVDPQADPRLNKTVSIRIASLPLYDLIDLLRSKTGIALRVEPTIGEYRACLYAPARPLHEVMTRIAEAFGYRWERIDQPNRLPTYRLVDPAPSTSKQNLQEQVKAFREQTVSKLCEALQIPVEERIETLKRIVETGQRPTDLEEQQRLSIIFASISTDTIPHIFCVMTDEHWNRIMQGETLLFGTKRGILLPQEAIRNWTAIAAEIAREQYERSSETSDSHSQWVREWELAQNEFPKADEMRVLYRYDPDENEFQTQYVVLANGKNVVPYSFGTQSAMRAFGPKTREYNFQRENATPLPDRPAFQKQLQEYREVLPTEDWFSWLGNLLVQMAEASGVPFAAEIYPFQPTELYRWEADALRPPISWQKVAGLLWKWGYRLAFPDDQWVVVQSRYRERARENDIPQSRLARWFYKPNKRGQLTLDDCAEIATLKQDQNEALYMYLQTFAELVLGSSYFSLAKDPDLVHLHGGLEWARATLVHFESDHSIPVILDSPSEFEGGFPRYPSGLRSLLRLYASLPSALRQQLLRGATIPFSVLMPAQQRTFLTVWSLDKGGPLMVESLWDSSGGIQLLGEGGLRLIFQERNANHLFYKQEIKKAWKSLEDLRQWEEEQRDLLRLLPQPVEDTGLIWKKLPEGSWEFQINWQGQTRSVYLLLHYPLRNQPSKE